jgi:hypothetical protein
MVIAETYCLVRLPERLVAACSEVLARVEIVNPLAFSLFSVYVDVFLCWLNGTEKRWTRFL